MTDLLIDELKKMTDTAFVFDDTHIRNDDLKIKILMNRCRHPAIRSLIRPCGELYAPVYYDRDSTIKLVWKPKWGGYIVCATFFQLAIFDIDIDTSNHNQSTNAGTQLCDFINADPALNNDLFYIHQTPRGFHLYLMSRLLNYCDPEVLDMGMKVHSDPAHIRNSMYTGYSVRCTRKPGDTFVSRFIGTAGTGVIDPEAERQYQLCQSFITKFSQDDSQSILSNSALRELFLESLNANGYFGNWHMTQLAPLLIVGSDQITHKTQIWNGLTDMGTDRQFYEDRWRKICKTHFYRERELLECAKVYGAKIKRFIQYKITESTNDYALGFDLGQSLYFISFRDLLAIDYDEQSKLKIVYEFCRYHPEYLFKIVKTNRGFHCFLLSHEMHHQSPEAIKMMLRLRSDPFHILGAINRGYSIRLNHKHNETQAYEEIATCGHGRCIPHLQNLYQYHLQLYRNCPYKFVCQQVMHTVMDSDVLKPTEILN